MAHRVPKKEIVWNISDTEYKVRNVTYSVFNDEEFYDLDVTLKLSMIKDLMVQEEIPTTIDFEKVTNLDVNI